MPSKPKNKTDVNFYIHEQYKSRTKSLIFFHNKINNGKHKVSHFKRFNSFSSNAARPENGILERIQSHCCLGEFSFKISFYFILVYLNLKISNKCHHLNVSRNESQCVFFEFEFKKCLNSKAFALIIRD